MFVGVFPIFSAVHSGFLRRQQPLLFIEQYRLARQAGLIHDFFHFHLITCFHLDYSNVP